MSSRALCPACGHELPEPLRAQADAVCPKCNAKLTVPDGEQRPAAPPKPPGAKPPPAAVPASSTADALAQAMKPAATVRPFSPTAGKAPPARTPPAKPGAGDSSLKLAGERPAAEPPVPPRAPSPRGHGGVPPPIAGDAPSLAATTPAPPAHAAPPAPGGHGLPPPLPAAGVAPADDVGALVQVGPSPHVGSYRYGRSSSVPAPLKALIAFLIGAVIMGIVLVATGVFKLDSFMGVAQHDTDEDAPSKKTKPAEGGPNGGKLSPLASHPPLLSDYSAKNARTAKNIEQARDAIVKIEVSRPDGASETATGFFISDRGWIATNYHVMAEADANTQALLANNLKFEIAGFVATDAEHDLAIVQLRDRPVQVTVLDIQGDARPALGMDVYAFGHPYDQDFSLVKGNVSRVVTTDDLLKPADSADAQLLKALHVPRDMVWVAHTAKTPPGSSGGPLFTADGRVLGVNTFVHLKAEQGYASDVRYLRTLLGKAGEEVTPLPEPGAKTPVVRRGQLPMELPEGLKLGEDRMKLLLGKLDDLKWDVQEAGQYAMLGELGRQLTFATYVAAADDSVETATRRSAAAAETFGVLKRRDFSKEQRVAINRLAVGQLEQPKAGVVFFGIVKGFGKDGLVLDLEGQKQYVWVQTGEDGSQHEEGLRMIVAGVATGNQTKLVGGTGEELTMPEIISHHVAPLQH